MRCLYIYIVLCWVQHMWFDNFVCVCYDMDAPGHLVANGKVRVIEFDCD